MESSVKQRLISYIEYKNISIREFERLCSLSNGYMKSLRHTPKIDKLSAILSACPDLNKTWLLTGEGEMLNGTAPPPKQNKDLLSEYETYLLPMTTHAGSLNGVATDGTILENCEKIISPIKNVDFAISIYGESMAPEYPSGSKVLIKKIDPNAFIDWGKAYVLDTCNGVILKEVIKSKQYGYITCHSINPDPKYSDFDISLADIYGMYRVLMCLSAK